MPGALAPVDVAVANILVGQLVRPSMVAALCANLQPGGLLCLSGIRPDEVPSLKKAYEGYVSALRELECCETYYSSSLFIKSISCKNASQ